MKLVIYSLKYVNGHPTLSYEYSNLLGEIVYQEYFMIDVPVTGVKKFVWYPYIVKNHIFDNGHVFFMIAEYKKLNTDFVFKYLVNYIESGRKNVKDYSKPPKPKKRRGADL